MPDEEVAWGTIPRHVYLKRNLQMRLPEACKSAEAAMQLLVTALVGQSMCLQRQSLGTWALQHRSQPCSLALSSQLK